MASDNLLIDLSIKAQINLYYDIYQPREITTPAPLLIAVHGYGAHKRYMMREARTVAAEKFVIASIQAPHPHYRQTKDGYRVGFGWLSDDRPEEQVQLHHKFVLDVVDKLASDGIADRDRVLLFGFSQACALNFRFAFTYPNCLRGIVGVCGGIPGDLGSNAAYEPFMAETLYLYGDDDEFYSQEQFFAFDSKLRELLSGYRSVQYHAGHEITDAMRADIALWLDSVISN